MALLSDFDPMPSRSRGVHVAVVAADADQSPSGAGIALGVAVTPDGPVPDVLGLDRGGLTAAGFTGRAGQTLIVPRSGGSPLVAVGIGDPKGFDVDVLRDAAAAFALALPTHDTLATTLADEAGIPAEAAAQAVVEGVLLARYRYRALKTDSVDTASGSAAETTDVSELTLVVAADRAGAAAAGAERGRVFAAATMLARDLANTPPAYLTATKMAQCAAAVAADTGLDVEIFGHDALVELGCGGLLGVNAGSAEPARMVKLSYRPAGAPSSAGAGLALVGKGIMYDSGGIALKPGDLVHAAMKNDMSGAAAILAAMSALTALGCRQPVTAWLMCTDNMPSGTAMAMGDVITMRGGKTVEVLNTDAEGRLVMADALVLAVEQGADAIVDIATLTGACLRALGPEVAGLYGSQAALVGQIEAAASATGEPVWELPLDKRYRSQLDSEIADISNMGGPNAGSTTAALFLAEFVGDVPWAHIDIAGTAQNDAAKSWRPKGCTGFGARLLLQFALDFATVGK